MNSPPKQSSTSQPTKKRKASSELESSVKADYNCKEEIDRLIARFIFGCNIPLSIVRNVYFQDLIKYLSPLDYQIPCIPTLSTTLLDSCYNELYDKSSSKRRGTLFVDGWKNSSSNRKLVVTMVKPRGEPEILVDSFDFTDESGNAVNLKAKIHESCETAKEKLNLEIDSTCTDNEPAMRKAARESNLVNYGCLAHIGDLMVNDVHDVRLEQSVKSVLVLFRKSNLQERLVKAGGSHIILRGETRWKGEKEELECFVKNFDHFHEVINNSSVQEVPEEIRQVLESPNILREALEEIKLQSPLCTFIDKSQKQESSLGEMVEDWIKIKVPDKFQKKKEKRDQMVFSEAGLTANVLNNYLKGSSLSHDQLASVVSLIRKKLRGTTEFDAFMRYMSSEREFSNVLLNSLPPMQFWESFKDLFPNLSEIGLLYCSLPASTASLERSFSQWGYVHNKSRNRLGADRSKKLFFIYHLLTLKAKNNKKY